MPKRLKMALPVIKETILTLFRDSTSKSKLHCWFKSYGDFAEWLDFVYWWSFIRKGLRATCEAGLFYIKPKFMVNNSFCVLSQYFKTIRSRLGNFFTLLVKQHLSTFQCKIWSLQMIKNFKINAIWPSDFDLWFKLWQFWIVKK